MKSERDIRKQRQLEDATVKSSNCPKCKAEIGQECLDLRNRFGTLHCSPHQERVKEFKAQDA